MLALPTVTISKDLDGYDVMLSFEIAKRFTEPIIDGMAPRTVFSDLITARENLMAKYK